MLTKGPWSPDQTAQFLRDTIIPLRLAVVRPDGMPLVLSLWFLPEEAALLCATSRGALIVRLLAENPRCAFEIAPDQPPYRGLRGYGLATLDHDLGMAVLTRLLDRYGIARTSKLGLTLLKPGRAETAICIVPQAITTWDFTSRMT